MSLRAEGLKLAGKWNVSGLRESVAAVAISLREPEQIRCAAIESLGSFGQPDAMQTLQGLAMSKQSPRVRCAAIMAEIGADQKAAAEAAATFLNTATDDSLVDQLFGAFLARPKAGTHLAHALAVTRPSADAAKIGLRRMSAAGQSDEKLLGILIDAAGLRREKKLISTSEISGLANE